MGDKLIRQHNFLTTARYEMSALQKNIMYMVLVQLRDNDPWGKQYEVPIQALREKRGVEIPRARLLSAAKKLIERGITIYHEDRKDFITIGILASADYGKEEPFSLRIRSKTIALSCQPKTKIYNL